MINQAEKQYCEQSAIVDDVMQNLGETLDNLRRANFTGAFNLEFNFHKGDISKKVKYGTIETSLYPRK